MDQTQYKSFKDKPAPVLAVEIFNVLIKQESCVIDLKSAVYLYQLMVILNVISDKSAKAKQSQEIRMCNYMCI